MKRCIYIVLAILVLHPVSVRAQQEEIRAYYRIDAQTRMRGFPFFSSDARVRVNLRPNALAHDAQITIASYTDRDMLAREYSAPVSRDFDSALYRIDMSDVIPADLTQPLVIQFTGSWSSDAAIFLYDRSRATWHPLPTHRTATGELQAPLALPFAQVAVLKKRAFDTKPPFGGVRAGTLFDGETQVSAKNAYDPMPIASLTKLMTALVFLDHNPGWGARMTVTAADSAEPANLSVRQGEILSVKDVFYATLVGSRNNMAQLLARSTGLSREQFVREMNTKAHTLGMGRSHFVEPTGLNPGNQSTATDLTRLAGEVFRNDAIARALQTVDYTVHVIKPRRDIRVKTTNSLLGKNPFVVGGKTGFTDEAGYTFIGRATEGSHLYSVVVLGAPTSALRFSLADDALRHAVHEGNPSIARR